VTEPSAAPISLFSRGQPGHDVTLVEGSTFCISEPGGDIRPGRQQGLFVRDTRVLSRWELTMDGAAPLPLTAQQAEPYSATFLCRVPPPAGLGDSTLLVERARYVGEGMREDLTIRNTGAQPVTCAVALAADADFADLFEVKDGRARPQAALSASGDSVLRFACHRGKRQHELLIDGGGRPTVTGRAMRWHAAIPAHGQWTASVEVVPAVDGAAMKLHHPRGEAVEHAVPARNLREWRRRAPQVHTADHGLATTLGRGLEDLGALRIFDPEHPERPVVAAGAPWFMALFGRDSLLTSAMLLPWDAGLAIGTLQTLADHQGRTLHAASEEEPGKILHEVRFGPAATLALGGRSAYYGTADATSLFVMLLGELHRWGGHDGEVRALLPHADRALEWIERYGDADGDGFVEYARKTERGLVNQGWKDSFDGVNFADGRLAEPPIALAEVQGYTYAAYRARAQIARGFGDTTGADHWDTKADGLKTAFNHTYWLPDRGWFAVALDRAKEPVDALTSNIGHCLWTGIIDEDKAERVAAHLLSDDMFSGWGVRTLAASMGAYNPMSYHNGSVWPHDNALCMAGLMRYGFAGDAQRVAEAVLDAASHFGHRLPELFCGFAREDYLAPVPYPTSCSPQAWAAAAPLHMFHSLLRLAPDLASGRAWCAPAVPRRYLPVQVTSLRLGGSRLAIDIRDDGWDLTGLDDAGITLIRTPPPVW
jgi:glycogen debranching enzyme